MSIVKGAYRAAGNIFGRDIHEEPSYEYPDLPEDDGRPESPVSRGVTPEHRQRRRMRAAGVEKVSVPYSALEDYAEEVLKEELGRTPFLEPAFGRGALKTGNNRKAMNLLDDSYEEPDELFLETVREAEESVRKEDWQKLFTAEGAPNQMYFNPQRALSAGRGETDEYEARTERRGNGRGASISKKLAIGGAGLLAVAGIAGMVSDDVPDPGDVLDGMVDDGSGEDKVVTFYVCGDTSERADTDDDGRADIVAPGGVSDTILREDMEDNRNQYVVDVEIFRNTTTSKIFNSIEEGDVVKFTGHTEINDDDGEEEGERVAGWDDWMETEDVKEYIPNVSDSKKQCEAYEERFD